MVTATLLRLELGLLAGLLVLASPPTQGDIFCSLGSSALLPCNTTSHRPVTTVMWFRGTSSDPFYSLDRRDGGSKHWTSRPWRGRAAFRLEGSGSVLQLGQLGEGDGGLYRCQVDYSQAPTTVSTVRLVLLVPPAPPDILDSGGNSLTQGSGLGPLAEGSGLSLHCKAEGGQPPPSLVWRRDNRTLNSSSEISLTPGGSVRTVTTSVLALTNLTRRDHGKVVDCLAQSLAIQAGLRASVTINMLLPPLSASVTPPSPGPLPAGSPATFLCRAPGSAPATGYRWRLEGDGWSRPLAPGPRLILAVDTGMHNATLVCTAYNPSLPSLAQTASLPLTVHYRPQVSLVLGSSISAASVREGEDIYLECAVKARPAAAEVYYTHQGVQVDVLRPGRTLVSRGILVLQNISREDAGEYVCVATNSLGEGHSQPVSIQVLFAPVCTSPPALYGLSVGDQVQVPCSVEANPTQDLTFHWFFNTTGDFKDFINLPSSPGPANSSQTVTFLARGARDYGTLQCFASNSVGHQELPCIATIIPSGPPDPPVNCSVGEPDPFKVSISCLPGYNGGLDQRFTAELYTSGEHESLQTTITNSAPVFTVYNLQPGTRYYVALHSSNAKGRSGEVRMKASTVKETFRLPLLPPDQGTEFLGPPSVPYQGSATPGVLEQTLFILLASLASLAFVVVLGLLLCKFQVGPGGLGGVITVTAGTSPLSARELVEISMHHEETSLH